MLAKRSMLPECATNDHLPQTPLVQLAGEPRWSTTMRIVKTVITPELARLLLEKNTKNRKVRTSHVKDLASAILRGEWQVTHQGIAISVDGTMIDGQHRCLAVIASNTPVEMMVAYDCAADIFSVTDSGAIRTMSDRSEIPRHICQTITYACSITTGSGKPSASQVTKLYGTSFGLSVERLLKHAPTKCKVFSAAACVSAAAAHLAYYVSDKNHAGENYVIETYRDLTTSNLNDMPPIARAWVSQTMRSPRNGRDENLFRAMKVFNNENMHHSKIVLPENAGELARKSLRDLLVLVTK